MSYIPWSSDHPRAHKVGWVRGEAIRFLRNCNHEKYFLLCMDRLRLALRRLGYPESVIYLPNPITWGDRGEGYAAGNGSRH